MTEPPPSIEELLQDFPGMPANPDPVVQRIVAKTYATEPERTTTQVLEFFYDEEWHLGSQVRSGEASARDLLQALCLKPHNAVRWRLVERVETVLEETPETFETPCKRCSQPKDHYFHGPGPAEHGYEPS